MLPYYGDLTEDQTIDVYFNTFTSDDPSASATITDFADTDVHIHKDGGLTQRNNAAGITVSVDFDGITGLHLIKIDTSDDTVGGFWVTGSDYMVRIEGTTVDGATINAGVGTFSIENRFNEVDVVKWLGQAAVAVSVNGVPEVDLTHIGGQAISGNNAILKRKQLDITNSAGTAIISKSTGSNGHGMDIAGNGTGEGLLATGGATGHGIEAAGGATSGNGIHAEAATEGDGIYAAGKGTDEHGIYAVGGDTTGSGIKAEAATSGDGILAVGATNGHGLNVDGAGSGEGINATGGATGAGIEATGGATSGAGIKALAQNNNDAGMELVKHGTGADLDADDLKEITAARMGALTDWINDGRLDVILDAVATEANLLAYVQLMTRKDAAIATDNGTELTAINTDGGSGGGTFSNQTDAEEALRDRGDAAWITATGFATAGDAMTLSSGSITAAVIATDAIDADAIKADAVTEIQSGLATATNVTNAHSTTDALIPTSADNPIKTDTYTLPGQGAPTATPTLEEAFMYLYKQFRNKETQTATEYKLYADDTTTVDQKSTVSDDATTFTKGEVGTGA